MWPWGHAAFGYILYSLGSRAVRGRPPDGPSVFVLLIATQLPDLVDKPLAWGLGLFPQGYAVGHSAFVAVPVGLLALLLGVRVDRRELGVAFVIGYWSHLAGDVVAPLATGDGFGVERVLWPLVTLPEYGTEYTMFERVNVYLSAFLELLSTSEQIGVLMVYFGPFLAAFVLWIVDGAPGVATLRRAVVGIDCRGR
ncbi:metal-dependent hydrolase [Halegenticoccus soli]|uniref:metal-dependent hydrolase n=1 Tax=Halegenticoccus soli TaxID=1985678 RepID=UPI000C6CDE41|nr:metal-dependent hydrolase [Halegenticoccus soli]